MSKPADRPYRVGRSKDWIKIKNRKHPTYRRVQDLFWKWTASCPEIESLRAWLNAADTAGNVARFPRAAVLSG